jgi:WD40 repeat protein
MADLFISYAHEDVELVERLRAGLESRGREVWSDRDIEPADRWRASATEAIERSDSVLFVISTASLASEPCRGELAYAAQAHKRLIAVCVEEAAAEVDDKPAEIAELSWIMLRPGDDFDAAIEKILRALDTDLDVVREHTRILVRARAWEIGGHRTSPLLRGDELRAAEDWLSHAPSSGVRPTQLQIEFIRASRSAATRRARTITAVSSSVAAAAIVLAIFALVERASAVHQAAIAGSRGLAAEGADPSAYGARLAALLSLQAYADSPTVQARSALTGAVEQPLLATRSAGVGAINAVAATSDGRLVAAGGADGVAIWRSVSGKRAALIRTHSQVNGLAFSPDGALIAAALNDGKVTIYRAASGAAVATLTGDGKAVTAVAFDPTGTGTPSVAYVTEGGTVELRDIATRAGWHQTLANDTLLSVAFAPGGAELAVGGGAGASTSKGVLVTFAAGGAQLGAPQAVGTGALSSLAFDHRGPLLAAASDDGNLYLIDPGSGTRTVIRGRAPLDVVGFSPGGDLVATGDTAGAVKLWNVASDTQVGETMNAGSIVYGLAFTDGGGTLVSGGLDGRVSSWTGDGQPPAVQTAAASQTLTGGIDAEAVNASATLLATADRNGGLTIWNYRTLRRLWQLSARGDAITAVAFAPRGDTLAVGLADGDVVFLDASSGKETGARPLTGVSGHWAVVDLAYGQGGRVAVAYYNGALAVWSVGARNPRRLGLVAQSGGATALAFSPSGQTLAAAFAGNGIYLYAPARLAARPRVIKVTDSIWSLAFAGASSQLLAGDEAGAVEIFNPSSGSQIAALPASGLPVFGLAVSPDGQTVATTDGGGELRLWDLPSRTELGQPLATGQSTLAAAFAPDGRSLVTGDFGGELAKFPSLLWSQSAGSFRAYLCPRLGGDLSRAEWSAYVPGRPYQATC